jgi:hypothetical protein
MSIFAPRLLRKENKPILETLQSQPRIKPKPRNKANQNCRRPKQKRKTLKPILATGQNQPELLPAKKIPPKKSQELENLLAEKILTKTAYLKNATAKKGFEFLSQLQRQPCESNMAFAFALWLCHPTVCVTRVWAGVDSL